LRGVTPSEPLILTKLHIWHFLRKGLAHFNRV
jgi:hypothetical protein